VSNSTGYGNNGAGPGSTSAQGSGQASPVTLVS
jgi:hypothetical protein